MNILVFDLGTTNFKASVFDEHGTLLSLTRLPAPIDSRLPDRCEIPLETFHATIARLLVQLNDESTGIIRKIDVITFATQTNSFILLDDNDNPLTPIILWSDNRALGDEQSLAYLHSLPDLCATTGVPALTHQFMIAKLAWLRKHEPEVIEKTTRLCLISDYFTLWLTGQHVTELGAAGLTGLLDIHKRTWWNEGCAAFRVPLEWLPRVVQAGTDLGIVHSDMAAQLGISETCRFVVGCLDQYAGAIGVGNVVPGGISETTGTVLATVKCVNSFATGFPPEVFQGPAFAPGMYFQMTFGNTSANCLEEYRNTLGNQPSFAELDSEAEQISPGIEGSTRAHAVRKILEAVSFTLADQVSMLCPETRPAYVSCAGGAARSQLWLQLKADVLNCEMISTQCLEPTSLGAAILAIHALSGESVSQIAGKWVKPNPALIPNEARHQHYTKLHPRTIDTK